MDLNYIKNFSISLKLNYLYFLERDYSNELFDGVVNSTDFVAVRTTLDSILVQLEVDANHTDYARLLLIAALIEKICTRPCVDLINCYTFLSIILLDPLSSGVVDIHPLAIYVATVLWKAVIHLMCDSCPDALSLVVQERLFCPLKEMCLAVLFHWDSTNGHATKAAQEFLMSLVSSFERHGFPIYLKTWIYNEVILNRLLHCPNTLHGPVCFPKGAIRCISVLHETFGINWLLERCPYLTASLLLCLGHNYSASTAGDLLTSLLLSWSAVKQKEILDRLWCSLATPLLSYILDQDMQLNSFQEMLGDYDESLQTVRNNRRNNFMRHCTLSSFLESDCDGLLIDAVLQDGFTSSFTQGLPLGHLLLEGLFLRMIKQQSALYHELTKHRLLMWLHLLNSMDSSRLLFVKTLSPLFWSLLHADDHVRALAFTVLVRLLSLVLSSSLSRSPLDELPFDVEVLPQGISLGLLLLSSSTSPVARKQLSVAYRDLLRVLRNSCVSANVDRHISTTVTHGNSAWSCLGEWRLPRVWSKFKALKPLATDKSTITSQTNGLSWLAQIVEFTKHLWGEPVSWVDNSLGDKSVCSHIMIWPGVSYQRSKMLIDLVSTTIGTLNFYGRMDGQWRTGYVEKTIERLRSLIDRLSIQENWQYRSRQQLLAFLHSLPLMMSDVQSHLVESVERGWPEGSELLQVADVDRLVQLALTWCDGHAASVYSAGVNLLMLLCSGGYLTTLQCTSLVKALDAKLILLSGDQSGVTGPLLLVAQKHPGLGHLMLIDRLLEALAQDPRRRSPRKELPVELVKHLTSERLTDMCFSLCNRCLTLMGCPQWHRKEANVGAEGDRERAVVVDLVSSSFRQLGEAIQRTVAIANREVDSSVPSINLEPEYQHVLSWSWNALRLASSILSRWAVLYSLRPCHEDSSPCDLGQPDDFVSAKVGWLLVHVLMHCRHRGTVESVCASLQFYAAAALRLQAEKSTIDPPTPTPSLASPRDMLDLCWHMICHRAYSVTRRSAGLWPALRACLLAEDACRSRLERPVLLVDWLNRLFDLVDVDDESSLSGRVVLPAGPLTSDSPRALGMHLLRGLFADASLRLHEQALTSLSEGSTRPWHRGDSVVQAFQRAILPGFLSSEWTVSNAALQLHSALVLRLTGSNTRRLPPTVSEVFHRYPQLFRLLLDWLSRAVETMNAEGGAGFGSTNFLLPVLTFLVRLSADQENSGDLSSSLSHEATEMCNLLRELLIRHPVARLRKLSALALLVLHPSTQEAAGGRTEVSRIGPLDLITCGSPSGSPSTNDVVKVEVEAPPWRCNAVQGQLFLLTVYFHRLSLRPESQRQAVISTFNWSNALNCLIKLLDQPSVGCGLLAAQLCDLMRTVFCLTKNQSQPGLMDVRRAFTDWLESKLPSILSTRHTESILALHRLSRGFSSTPGLLLLTETSLGSCCPKFVLRLLSTPDGDDVDSSEWSACAHSLLTHWINQSTIQPMLVWRIVEVWSSACLVGLDLVQIEDFRGHLIHRLTDLLKDSPRVIGSQDACHRSRVAVCAASLLRLQKVSLGFTRYRLNWWLDLLTDCLLADRPETARVLAGQALLVFFGLNTQADAASISCMTIEQRGKLLGILFFAIFDECASVREDVSIVVQRLLPEEPNPNHQLRDQSISHLLTAHRLLDEVVPHMLSPAGTPCCDLVIDWLCSTWLEVMHQLNDLLVDEFFTRSRSVLYENEVKNDFAEPRLQLELILGCLERHSAAEGQIQERLVLLHRLTKGANDDLTELCNRAGSSPEQVIGQLSNSENNPSWPLFTRSLAIQQLDEVLTTNRI